MVQLMDGMIFELASRLEKWRVLHSYHVMNQDEWCLTCLVVPELQQSALKKKEQFYYLLILPHGSIFIFFLRVFSHASKPDGILARLQFGLPGKKCRII